MFQRSALGLVVVDPKLRFILSHQIRNFLHRRNSLLLVEIRPWHAAVIPIVLKMDRVAAQDDRTGGRQPDHKTLVAGSVPWRRKDNHAAIAENVVIAVKLLHGMFGFEPRCTERARPLIFGLLDKEKRLRKEFRIADMVGMGVRNGEIFDVGGLEADFRQLSFKGLGPFPDWRAIGAAEAFLG